MERDVFAKRYGRASEWPLTFAALLFLFAYACPVLEPDLPSVLRRGCAMATIAIWLVFAGDFVLRLALARRKVRFVRAHVVDRWCWHFRCFVRCGRSRSSRPRAG